MRLRLLNYQTTLPSINFISYKFSLLSVFIILFVMILMTPIIERLMAIGTPDLSIVRFGLSALLFCFCLLFILEKGLYNKFTKMRYMIFFLLIFLMIIYELSIMYPYKEHARKAIFFLFYINFSALGIVLLMQNKLVNLERFLNIVTAFEVIVATFMFIIGPVVLEEMLGVQVIKEGQSLIPSLFDRNIDNVRDIKIFRCFGLFDNYQSYSGFLMLMSFFYRLLYEIKKEKSYLWKTIILTVANVVTFSTTGLACLLVILVSFGRLRNVLFMSGLIIVTFSFLLSVNFDLFNMLFHLGSLNWRLIFIQRLFDVISWQPHVGVLGGDIVQRMGLWFTSDSYILYYSYAYGLFFGLLFIVMLTLPIFIARSKKILKMSVLFFIINFLNIISNGVLFSTPNNILLPMFWGILVGLNYCDLNVNDKNKEVVYCPQW